MWRIKDEKAEPVADVMALDDPHNPDTPEKGCRYAFWHPQADYRHFYHTISPEGSAEPLLVKQMENGKTTAPAPGLSQIQQKVKDGLKCFDQSYKRILNPHIYKVSVTERLRTLKLDLIKAYDYKENDL